VLSNVAEVVILLFRIIRDEFMIKIFEKTYGTNCFTTKNTGKLDSFKK